MGIARFSDDNRCVRVAYSVRDDGSLQITMNGWVFATIHSNWKVDFGHIIKINEDSLTGTLLEGELFRGDGGER
jgi:hypothetical protein